MEWPSVLMGVFLVIVGALAWLTRDEFDLDTDNAIRRWARVPERQRPFLVSRLYRRAGSAMFVLIGAVLVVRGSL